MVCPIDHPPFILARSPKPVWCQMIRRVTPFRLVSLFAAVLVLSAAECPVDDVTDPSDPPTPSEPTPTSLELVDGNNQAATVGQELADPLIVRVDDQSGNAMSDVTVSFVAQGGGSVTPTSATTGSDGRAQTSWTLGNVAGDQEVEASVSGISSPLTFAATANADAPDRVTLNGGDAQQVLEGTAVPIPPSVLVEDQYDNAVPDVQVTFAVASGGGDLSGAVTTTGSDGIATVGSWVLGAGANTLTATVTGTGVTGNPVTFSATGLITLYDVEVRYVVNDSSPAPTATQLDAFNNAADRWQSVIVGDLPAHQVTLSAAGVCGGAERPAIDETIEDVLIYVQFVAIDGPFGVQGQAGPCVLRNGSLLPSLGGMLFDLADLARLEANGDLETVILHEMGHVLGFGTLWPTLSLLQDPSDVTADPPGVEGNDTYFSGARALAVFDSLDAEAPGPPYSGAKVPVENDFNTYGPGSLDGHWRESVFDTELMTPSLNGGVANPLGVVTTASLGDMGYQVRESASDPYVLPSGTPLASSGAGLIRLDGDIWRGPIAVVDETGSLVRVIRRQGGSAVRR
jgi:hypothetical protein